MTNRELIVEILELWKSSLPHAHAVYHKNSPCCNKSILEIRINELLSKAETSEMRK